MWNYKQPLKHKTTIVVNRILKKNHICFRVLFHPQIQEHQFQEPGFMACPSAKNTRLQSRQEGKASQKRILTAISCSLDSPSLIQKQSVELDFLFPWKKHSHYWLHINNYATLINWIWKEVYEKRKKGNKISCCVLACTLTNNEVWWLFIIQRLWSLQRMWYFEFKSFLKFQIVWGYTS